MSYTIFEKEGTLLTVRPEGRLDTATSPELDEELKPYLDGVQHMIMDFERVEYVSSGGLRLLLNLEQQLEDRGGNMKLIHVNKYIIEVFELTGFMNVIKIERD